MCTFLDSACELLPYIDHSSATTISTDSPQHSVMILCDDGYRFSDGHVIHELLCDVPNDGERRDGNWDYNYEHFICEGTCK